MFILEFNYYNGEYNITTLEDLVNQNLEALKKDAYRCTSIIDYNEDYNSLVQTMNKLKESNALRKVKE